MLEHNTIAANLVAALYVALEPTGCRALGSDQKVYSSERLGYYPDVTVLCASPLVAFGEALQNPILLAEVLSASTAAHDRGTKFRHYRTIESLRHYLLIEQDAPVIEHHERAEEGYWLLRGEYTTLDDTLQLSLDGFAVSLPLTRIYRFVTFPATDVAVSDAAP
jgi:Uma2 family endonuclease